MSAASTDQNQESIGNTMGAPGVEAQGKLEQQPAVSHISTSPEKTIQKVDENETQQKQIES